MISRLPSVLFFSCVISANTAYGDNQNLSCPERVSQEISEGLIGTLGNPVSEVVALQLERNHVARSLVQAGYFADARRLLDTIFPDGNLPPAAILNYAASYRLQAQEGDLIPPGVGVSSSDLLAQRQDCMLKAKTILNNARTAVGQAIGAKPKERQEKTASVGPPETALILYGLYSLELAELSLVEGDFHFQREVVSPFALFPDRESRERGNAMLAYRQARFHLAAAEAARSPRAIDDVGLLRRSLLADKLDQRIEWLIGGLNFGGNLLLKEYQPLGGLDEPAQLTIMGQLESALEEFDEVSSDYGKAVAAKRDDLITMAKELAEGSSEFEQFRTVLRSDLMRELALVETGVTNDAVRIKETIKNHKLETADIRRQYLGDRKTIEAQIQKSADQIVSAVDSVAAALTAVGTISPYDVAKPTPLVDAWGKAEEAFDDVFPATPTETAKTLAPMLDAVAGTLEEEKNRALSLSRERLTNASQSFTSPTSLYAVAASELADLKAERDKLESDKRRLEFERLIEVAEEQKFPLDNLNELEALAREKADILISTADQLVSANANDIDRLKGELIKAQKNLIDEGKSVINREIDAVKARIADAKAIIVSFQQGAENIQRVIEASQAVFTTMQAIPSGTGLVMIQDRASLVALQESGTKLLEAGLQTRRDVYKIRSQIEDFETHLNEYRRRLGELSIEKIEVEINRLVNEERDNLKQFLVDTRDQRLKQIEAARKRLEDRAKFEQTINSYRQQIVGEDIVAVERKIEVAKRRTSEAEARIRALGPRSLDASLSFASRLQELHVALAAMAALQSDLDLTEERFKAERESAQQRFEELMSTIEESQELKRTRVGMLLLALREGEASPETAFGVDWSASRATIIGSAPMPDAEFQSKLTSYLDARAKVNRLIFDYVNALFVLSQDSDILKYAVHARNSQEAKTVVALLDREYRDEIKSFLGEEQAIRLMALTMSPDDIRRWGARERSDGTLELPKCSLSDASEARCLRIQILSSPTVADFNDDLPPAEDSSLKEFFRTSLGAENRNLIIHTPVNNALVAKDDTSISPQIVFAPNLLMDRQQARLRTVFLLSENSLVEEKELGLTGFTIGPRSVATCGQRQMPLILPSLDATDIASRRDAGNPVDFDNGAKQTIAYLDDYQKAASRYSTIAKVADFPRAMQVFGRGLGNTFEVQIKNLDKLAKPLHLMVIFRPEKCDPDAGFAVAKHSEFRSNTDDLVDSYLNEGNFLAAALAGLEVELATTVNLLNDTAVASDAGEIATDARLSNLEALSSLLSAAIIAEAEKNDTALDTSQVEDRALSILRNDWSRYDAAIRLRLPDVPSNALLERVGDIVLDELDAVTSTQEMSWTELIRPPSLASYEKVAREALGSDPTALATGLAEQMVRELKKAQELSEEIDIPAEFMNRANALNNGITSLLNRADKRMLFLAHVADELKDQFPDRELFALLPEMLCLANVLEDPAFWIANEPNSSTQRLHAFEAWQADNLLPHRVSSTLKASMVSACQNVLLD